MKNGFLGNLHDGRGVRGCSQSFCDLYTRSDKALYMCRCSAFSNNSATQSNSIPPWPPYREGEWQRSHDMGDDGKQLVKAARIWILPLHFQGAQLGRLVNPRLRRSGRHLATMITDHFCHLSLLHLPPADLTLFPLDLFFLSSHDHI